MKKPPRTPGGFFDGEVFEFQQDAFIMHNLRDLLKTLQAAFFKAFTAFKTSST